MLFLSAFSLFSLGARLASRSPRARGLFRSPRRSRGDAASSFLPLGNVSCPWKRGFAFPEGDEMEENGGRREKEKTIERERERAHRCLVDRSLSQRLLFPHPLARTNHQNRSCKTSRRTRRPRALQGLRETTSSTGRCVFSFTEEERKKGKSRRRRRRRRRKEGEPMPPLPPLQRHSFPLVDHARFFCPARLFAPARAEQTSH